MSRFNNATLAVVAFCGATFMEGCKSDDAKVSSTFKDGGKDMKKVTDSDHKFATCDVSNKSTVDKLTKLQGKTMQEMNKLQKGYAEAVKFCKDDADVKDEAEDSIKFQTCVMTSAKLSAPDAGKDADKLKKMQEDWTKSQTAYVTEYAQCYVKASDYKALPTEEEKQTQMNMIPASYVTFDIYAITTAGVVTIKNPAQ